VPVSRRHAESIVGLPYEEGRSLIEELNALAIHPDLSYEHRWRTVIGEVPA
jgi:alpha-ketoglutarate-dependent taurine dioxygenase